MKRFWLACIAVAAVTTTTGTVNAQWNQSPEIGSYQSILSRTGYGASSVGGAVGSVPGSLPGQLVNMAPQAVAPVSPVAYAPQVTSYAPQATSGCSGGCNGGCGGGASYGGQMAPMMSGAPAYGAATSCGGGGCGGNGGGGYIGGSVSSYTDMGADYGASSCGAPVYTPGASIGNIVSGAPSNNSINRVGGLFGVIMRRNYADPVRLGADSGKDIFTDDIDHGNFSGMGVSLAGRKANGNGRELVYWGLDEDTDIEYNSPDFVSLGQLEYLELGGDTVLNYFNGVSSLRIYRDTEINNVEANLLRNGGSYNTRHGKSGNFELLGGLRMFQFDESLRLVGNATGSTEYRLAAQNFMVGAQLGARNEVCLTNRLRLSTGINVGLFNNRSETRQRVFDQDGTTATVVGGPADGRDFDYSDTQDDIAVMGEFRVGVIMQISQRLRANAGYRALGVGGVALAEDQTPLNILDPGELLRSNTNGNLLLHGFYFGGEACF